MAFGTPTAMGCTWQGRGAHLLSQGTFRRRHGEGAQLKVALAVRCQQGVTASETKIGVAERGGS